MLGNGILQILRWRDGADSVLPRMRASRAVEMRFLQQRDRHVYPHARRPSLYRARDHVTFCPGLI